MISEYSIAPDPKDALYYDSHKATVKDRVRNAKKIAHQNANSRKKKSALSSAAKGAAYGLAIGAGFGLAGKKSKVIREMLDIPQDLSAKGMAALGAGLGGSIGGATGYSIRSRSNNNIDKSIKMLNMSDEEIDKKFN